MGVDGNGVVLSFPGRGNGEVDFIWRIRRFSRFREKGLVADGETVRVHDLDLGVFRRGGVLAVGFAAGFPAGLAAGFAAGLAAGFPAGLAAGLAAGFAAGLAAGFAAGLAAGFPAGPAAGFPAGLAAGLAAGPAAGFAVGLAAGPAAGFAVGLIFPVCVRCSVRWGIARRKSRVGQQGNSHGHQKDDCQQKLDFSLVTSHVQEPRFFMYFGRESAESAV